MFEIRLAVIGNVFSDGRRGIFRKFVVGRQKLMLFSQMGKFYLNDQRWNH